MNRFVVAMLVGLGAAAAGCASGGATSSDAGTGPPAVCSSTDALLTSMANLGDVQVVENGTAALEDALASLRSALQEVVEDATSEYATQVDGLQSGFDALQEAAGAALDAPTADTLNAVAVSVRALAADVGTFADDVATTC